MKRCCPLLPFALLSVAMTCAHAAPKPIRTLIVGGGSSHDFNQWFNQADSATLQTGGKATVTYTDKPDTILPALKKLDVLYLSNNQSLPDAKLRKGIFDFLKSGRGLLLIHPACWYNWKDWPDYNRLLVGGGALSHGKYGAFEVTVTDPNHPVMAGVPKTFKISDELYRFEPHPQGAPIHVLATGQEPVTGKPYPVVWIVAQRKGRVVCCTLGHDGQAHEHPAYKAILQNSLQWVAKKRK